ncbi:MAG: putative Ig domain-containing protein [Verrucomicrobia bacterium]|nr:putative Ig domain-containing protein [Verrucomicrobiota bacterium]
MPSLPLIVILTPQVCFFAVNSNDLPSGITLTQNGDGSAQLSGTPTESGTFEIMLTVTDGDYVTWQIFDLEIEVQPTDGQSLYANWAASNAIVGDATDVTDGVVNLVRYALGGTKSTPAADLLPQMQASLSPDGLGLQLSFHRIDDPSILYAVWLSTDLNDWGTEPVWQGHGANNGIPGIQEVQVQTPGPRGFLRLQVTLQD